MTPLRFARHCIPHARRAGSREVNYGVPRDQLQYADARPESSRTRSVTIQSARLYGAGSAVEYAGTLAWTGVGAS